MFYDGIGYFVVLVFYADIYPDSTARLIFNQPSAQLINYITGASVGYTVVWVMSHRIFIRPYGAFTCFLALINAF